MRIIASIYFAIVLADFGFWLANGLQGDIFSMPYYYLTWSLHFFSLLSLLGYVVNKLFLPQRIWQILLVVYVTTRSYELVAGGLVLGGESLGADLNIVFSYLWLVFPAGLAMWYLGFTSSSFRSQDIDLQTHLVPPHSQRLVG